MNRRTSTLRDHRARCKSVGDTLRKISSELQSRQITQKMLTEELLNTLEQLSPKESRTQQALSQYLRGEAFPKREVMISLIAAIDKLTHGQERNMPLFASTLLLDAGYRGLEAPEVLAAFFHRFADGDFVPTRRAAAGSMADFITPIADLTPIADFFQLDFDTSNARLDLYRPLRSIGKEVYRSLQETNDDGQRYSPADDLSPPENRAEVFGRRFKWLLDNHTDLRSKDVDSASVEECNRLYPDGAKNSRRYDRAALAVSPRRWSEGDCLPRYRESLIVAFSVMARSHGATILPIHFDLMAMDAGLRGLEERELRGIFGCSDIDCDRLSELTLSTADRREVEQLVRAEYGALAVQRKMQPLLYWAYDDTKRGMAAGQGFDRRQFLGRFEAAKAVKDHKNQYPNPTEQDLQGQYMEEFIRHDRRNR